MIKLSMSSELKKKQKRLAFIKKNAEKIGDGIMRDSADKFMKMFHDNIKKNALGLEMLKPATVRSKKAQGMSKPQVPLYGKGDEEEKNSYVNMLRAKKIKGGYNIKPSTAKHWSKNITLDKLFMIHEYGAKIKRGDGNVTVIPKRPAFRMTEEKFMRSWKNPKTRLDRLIKGYVRTGKYESELKELIRKGRKEDKD